MLRILILVRTTLLAEGIHSTLQQIADWQVQRASIEDAEAVAELAEIARPDVTILEAGAGGVFCLFERLGKERVRLLGRTMAVTVGALDEESLFRLALWGASAYLDAWTPLEDFVTAVRRVAGDEWLLSAENLPVAAPSVPAPPEQRYAPGAAGGEEGSPLTAREATILHSIARGMGNKQVARALMISDQTVKNHINSIFKKLGVSDRTAAVVAAFRRGWIELPACPCASLAAMASVA